MAFSQPPESEAALSSALSAGDLHDAWPALSAEERRDGFELCSRVDAEKIFLELSSFDQAQLVRHLPPDERRMWLRILPPDDAADLLQRVPAAERDALLSLLDDATLREVRALLAHAEDAAGGLMNPRFTRVRPEMTVDEAIRYVRKQPRERSATVYYVYVLDPEQHLLGVLSFRELLSAAADKTMAEIMQIDVLRLSETTGQRDVARLFAKHGFLAMPVVDSEDRMVGIVTVDDVVDVVEEAATEDIQRIGGGEALGAPYLSVGFGSMIKKRGGWLSALFLGEMLTATAMGHFEAEIAKAVVLALFVPLIISSGGNSGSQATTIVIRAMALGEFRLRDWWRIAFREIRAGLVLGLVLGVIGIIRIYTWQNLFHTYGAHWVSVAITVGLSLIGVVTFGTLAGSMLPFILRRFGFDPASASAPFVATLVDVSGLVIYFTVASLVMSGGLL